MASALEVGIELWNDCVKKVKQQLQDPEALLKAIQDHPSEMEKEEDLQKAVTEFRARSESLREISLKGSDDSFQSLYRIYIYFFFQR